MAGSLFVVIAIALTYRYIPYRSLRRCCRKQSGSEAIQIEEVGKVAQSNQAQLSGDLTAPAKLVDTDRPSVLQQVEDPREEENEDNKLQTR